MHTKRLKQLLNLEKINPTDPFIKFAIAKEYSNANDLKNALLYFTDLLDNQPDYLGTYYHAGKLMEELDQPEKAIEIYETGMVVAVQQNDQHSLSELNAVCEDLRESF